MKKIVCLALAAVFFVLGLIGLAIPVIPQVPFFAVSVALASIGSPWIKRKVTGTRIYREYLADEVHKHKVLAAIFE